MSNNYSLAPRELKLSSCITVKSNDNFVLKLLQRYITAGTESLVDARTVGLVYIAQLSSSPTIGTR